jgi:hypothetical protein
MDFILHPNKNSNETIMIQLKKKVLKDNDNKNKKKNDEQDGKRNKKINAAKIIININQASDDEYEFDFQMFQNNQNSENKFEISYFKMNDKMKYLQSLFQTSCSKTLLNESNDNHDDGTIFIESNKKSFPSFLKAENGSNLNRKNNKKMKSDINRKKTKTMEKEFNEISKINYQKKNYLVSHCPSYNGK